MFCRVCSGLRVFRASIRGLPMAEVSKKRKTYRKWLCNIHLKLLSFDFLLQSLLFFAFSIEISTFPYFSIENSTFSLLFDWNLHCLSLSDRFPIEISTSNHFSSDFSFFVTF